MRLIMGTLAGVGLLLAVPAVAQAQAGIAVGMQVTDASGGPVGIVASIQGQNLLVKTDKHEALLPQTSFSVSNGKLLFGMSQAQLDSEIEKNIAVANAAIVAGATVKGLAGTPVGTIDSVADGKATIALQGGKKIAVQQDGLRGNADGSVTIGLSAAQLESLMQGGASAGSTPSSGSSGQ